MNKNKVRGIIGLLILACGVIAMVYFGWQIAAYGWRNPDLTDRRILRDMSAEYIYFYVGIVCSFIGGRLFVR